MANNNGFGNFDMAALLNSGLDLSMLNSLSGMNQPQQRPAMPMQNQGPPMQNMGGMQGMNLGMMGNGAGMPQNMGGNGSGNTQQSNNGMTNTQLLNAYNQLQAAQSSQRMQNRSGTPNMATNMPRMPSGQFQNGPGQPPAQQQQQQQHGDGSNHYQQLQRLLASKNTAGALQNPMRPPFNQSQSNDMMQEGRNPGQNGMNPQLAATQAQLRMAASTNLTRVQQMQQSMQQQIQQNSTQQSNPQVQNTAAIPGNMFNNFLGQNNPNQFNLGNNMTAGQNPGPSPQLHNAQQQQVRPPANMSQSSPLGPGRVPPQGGAIPQNLIELNQQFQQLNEQQRQQLMSLYQHQGRAQNAFSNQMTPRTLSQTLQSVGNLDTSPMSVGPTGQNQGPNPNMNMQAAQGQAMAAAQQRAHLAQQAQQAANQFGNNGLNNQQMIQPSTGGSGPGLKPGQPGTGPNNANGPPRTFEWEKISDAELIETGKGMLPKLAAQIKALQGTPQNSPHRASMENQIRNNNQIRVTFVKEMRRRNLDMSLVGGLPAGVAQQMQQQQAQLATPQGQNQSLVGSNLGAMSKLNSSDPMQMDAQAQQGGTMGPGGFQNGLPPRAGPNPVTDSGFAANGLPKATTPQGRAIQEAQLVMPRQKFAEIVGSIYRNSRKTEIPQHIIENRPLDLYALFTTVAKFGGCAEVSSKDIWSMVGGLMGFVHNGGPPPISSAEVARQLQQIYSEALHVIEGHYLSVIVKQKKESAAMLSRQNQASAGTAGPNAAGKRNFGEMANQVAPANVNQQPPPPNGANTGPPVDTGGFTLDQLNRLATANSAQLASYNLTPEQMSIIQRHRATLLAAYQQKTGGMRPPGVPPALPGMLPNAKGEWVIKGRVITPQEYEKGKQIVAKMYNTHIATIQLAQEQIPEAERANYQKQITNSMQMLKSFDHILTLEFAMRPQRQNDPEVINLYKVAGLLRRAVGKWVTEHVAMLKPQVLGSAFSKVAVETNKIRKTHLPDPPPIDAAPAPAGISSMGPQNPDKAPQPAEPLSTAAGASGAIPPRLRVEDLKQPPGKRQKSNVKDDRSSPAATTARGMSVGTDGNPPTPTVAQNAAMSSPTAKKAPRPKPQRRKPSMASASKPDITPKVEKLPVISSGVADAPSTEASLTLPQFTGLADISPQNNSLGISFRQMGSAAVSAHRKEEEDGRVDPLSFLEASMAKLEDVMRTSGQTFTGLERDLAMPITPSMHDTRFDPSKQTRSYLQQRPREQDPAFDYSSFIDESAFAMGDDDLESADKAKRLPLPAETPELVPIAPGVVDPSPTSVVAITPHGVQSSNMEDESVYSPKQGNFEYPLGEDGWLDNLGMDPTYWMS